MMQFNLNSGAQLMKKRTPSLKGGNIQNVFVFIDTVGGGDEKFTVLKLICIKISLVCGFQVLYRLFNENTFISFSQPNFATSAIKQQILLFHMSLAKIQTD